MPKFYASTRFRASRGRISGAVSQHLGGMFRFVRSYFARRAELRREADELFRQFGDESSTVARSRAYVARGVGLDEGRAWQVVRLVDRRVGHAHLETATRHLEGSRR